MPNYMGTRWRGQIPIPPHAHPLVRRLIEILNEEETTVKEAAKRANASPATVCNWRYRSVPRLDMFEAVLNSMDYELKIVKRAEARHG